MKRTAQVPEYGTAPIFVSVILITQETNQLLGKTTSIELTKQHINCFIKFSQQDNVYIIYIQIDMNMVRCFCLKLL